MTGDDLRVVFVTGPEGSGTTVLIRALSGHPVAVRGDAARHGHAGFHYVPGGDAAVQVLPSRSMSTRRAGDLALEDADGVRRLLRENVARLAAGQPAARALFFKYSTPTGRPPWWPVFAPLCALPEFRVVVIRRRPIDTIYSGFRRFYRDHRPEVRGVALAALTYLRGRRHLARQLARIPREQALEIRYEALVAEPDRTLGAVFAFAGVAPCPVTQLLATERVVDENGKWRQAVANRLGRGRTRRHPGAMDPRAAGKTDAR